tara:strand:- start:910 stop:4179 length:3270 start_codon:yes stop_codon:yes gene_type:complete
MHVCKRNKTKEEVSFDKIKNRIKILCNGLSVDPIIISQKVISRIYDGVKTSDLDELAAQICASLATTNMDYGILASRIIISNSHKNTSPSFSEVIGILYNNIDIHGGKSPLISTLVYNIAMKNKKKLNNVIKYDRDFGFDYFAYKTLERAYLLRVDGQIVERIQHLFMRVSLGIHGTNIKKVIESYNLMSQKYFTHATPTLFHAGTPRQQLLSCFLLGTHDSVDGMYKNIGDCASISKWAGGIGVHISDIRSKNAVIRSTNGKSNGIIPMLRVYNECAKHINQCFVPDTIVYTKSGPKMIKNVMANDYVITKDGSFKQVFRKIENNINKTILHIYSYNSIEPIKCTKVHQIYTLRGRSDLHTTIKLLKDNIQVAQFRDASDINENIDYLVLPIPTTIIDNDNIGYKECYDYGNELRYSRLPYIEERFLNLPKEKTFEIIRGFFGVGPIFVKSSNKILIHGLRYLFLKIGILTSGEKMNDEYTLYLNNEHYFIHNNIIYSKIQKIEKVNYKGCVYDLKINDNHNYLTHGGLVHNSGKRNGSIAFYLEPHHPEILEFLQLRKNHGNEDERCRDLFLALWISDLFMKRVKSDGDWSVFDSDECPHLTDKFGKEYEDLYIQYEKDGKSKKVIKAREIWKNIIDSQIETGTPYILFKDNINNKNNQSNLGTIKSSNLCAEIVEYSDDKEYACCTLASIPLCKFVNKVIMTGKFTIYGKTKCSYCKLAKLILDDYDYEYVCLDDDKKREQFYLENQIDIKEVPQIFYKENDKPRVYIGNYDKLSVKIRPIYDFDKLKAVVKVVIGNLNNIIDLNFYPVIETKISNEKHRPLGLGVQGLADTYALMRFPFESSDAMDLNKLIFETMYFAALEESCRLAKNDGAYSTYDGSPLSRGKFQFDMWNVTPSKMHNWVNLRKKIDKYGVRNSLLLALMPTASTSQILGNNECFEPFTSNIYSRRTLAGDFVIINKYLISDLTKMGIWSPEIKNKIILNNGSIQAIKEIPDIIKELYKSVWEMKQKTLIKQCIDRGAFICQTQSMNLFFEEPSHSQLTGALFYGWENGLKTGSYYIRTRPKVQAQQFTIDPTKYDVCESCSG